MNETLAKSIGAVAATRLIPEQYQSGIDSLASILNPGQFEFLLSAIDTPLITAAEAGAPPTISHWDRAWRKTILDLLANFGIAAEPIGRKFLEDADVDIQEQGLLLLGRLATRDSATLRANILAHLRVQLPGMHNREVRRVISELLMDARRDTRADDVLNALGDIVVRDYGNGQVSISEIVKQVYVAPPPPPPKQLPEHKTFAEDFATAVLNRDFEAAHALCSPSLRKSKTKAKLISDLEVACKHCGWPVSHQEAEFSGLRVSELRDGPQFRLPKSLLDEEFRNWMWVEFLPKDGSDSDFAFELGIAVVEIKGKLMVGYYWANNED